MICPLCNNKFSFLGMPLKKYPKAGKEKGRILCPKCGASLRMQYRPILGLNFQQLTGIFIGIVMLVDYLNYAFFGNNEIVALTFNVGGIILFVCLFITYMDKYATAVAAEKFHEPVEESDQAMKNLSSAASEAIFKGDDKRKKIITSVLRKILMAAIIVMVFYPLYKNFRQILEERKKISEERARTADEFNATMIKNTEDLNRVADRDNDGLPNAQEKTYGTNPSNPDTDGDGFTDGDEVKNGYDPLKPAPEDKIIGNKIVKEYACPVNTATIPEDVIRLAAEAGQKGDGSSLLCYFIPEARQSLTAPMQDSGNAKGFGEMLSRAIKKDSTESSATFKSTYKDGTTDYSNFIYLVKGSDGKWLIKGL